MAKFNMGCGANPMPGYVNVDKYPSDAPNFVQWDLERTPWPIHVRPDSSYYPFKENCADEVVFNHSLEHMGHDPEVFLRIMQELYRIAAPNCVVQINVPHPRHDDFMNDPTHVRAITPEMLGLFSRSNCMIWKTQGAANTPLALYLDVDFEVVTVVPVADPAFVEWIREHSNGKGIPSPKPMQWVLHTANNCIKEVRITMHARKPIKSAPAKAGV